MAINFDEKTYRLIAIGLDSISAEDAEMIVRLLNEALE